MGIQVRKLYEPEKYPKANVNPVFDQYFGKNRDHKTVCAVGFEPNPSHSKKLKGEAVGCQAIDISFYRKRKH